MAILINCHAADLVGDNEFRLTVPKERGLRLVEADEVFLWISDAKEEEAKEHGLTIWGELASLQSTRQGTSVTVRVRERLTKGCFGLDALSLAAGARDAAHSLHQRIAPNARRRVWAPSSGERQFLDAVFRACA